MPNDTAKVKKKKSDGPVALASQSNGRNSNNLNSNRKTKKKKTKKNQEPTHLSLADAKTQYRQRQQQPASSRSNTEPSDLSARRNQNHENLDTIDEPSSAPSTLFARFRFNNKRNNPDNSTSDRTPPSLSSQQNYQQPGAFFVNGNSRQDDSDSSHDFHNTNTVQSGNAVGAADDEQDDPVVEAFLQEEDSRSFEQRRPPSMVSAPAPAPTFLEEEEPENLDEKSSEDDSTCCSLNLIFIIGLCLAVIIIVVTVVVIVVVTLGSSDTGNETPSMPSVPPISSTSPSTAPSMGPTLSYPLIFDGVNVNDYLYMGVAATQFGFDQSDCFGSTQDPHVVELTCPRSSAAIVLLRVIGYNALGVEQERPPLDCETKSARSITCTYREIQSLEMAAQTTIFLTTCASDAYLNFEADVTVESKSIALSSCPENPAQFSHSLSIGHFCDDDQFSIFGTGIWNCQGSTSTVGSVGICGDRSSCNNDGNGSCSLQPVSGQVDVNTENCSIFKRTDWGDTWDDILNGVDPMVETLEENRFIMLRYGQESLEALEG